MTVYFAVSHLAVSHYLTLTLTLNPKPNPNPNTNPYPTPRKREMAKWEDTLSRTVRQAQFVVRPTNRRQVEVAAYCM